MTGGQETGGPILVKEAGVLFKDLKIFSSNASVDRPVAWVQVPQTDKEHRLQNTILR